MSAPVTHDQAYGEIVERIESLAETYGLTPYALAGMLKDDAFRKAAAKTVPTRKYVGLGH